MYKRQSFPRVNFANGTPAAGGDPIFSPLYPSLCGAQIGPTAYPGIVHLDPIGFSNDFILNPGGITIPTATFYDQLIPAGANQSPGATAITTDEAARLCRYRDNLISEIDNESIDDVAPPQPIFDRGGGINGTRISRQFSGRISWSALLVPDKDPSIVSVQVPASRYRVYTLVYQDRFGGQAPVNVIQVDLGDQVPEPGDPAEEPEVFQQAVTRISTLGLPAVDGPDRIRNGDWVMVINRLPSVGSGSPFEAREGYRTQVMFARVTSADPGSGQMLVDGGSFAFTPVVGDGSETFVVHLRNVISVYERTVSIEHN